jgi:hypothetical protein
MAVLEEHATACDELTDARRLYETALVDLRAAERKRGAVGADGIPRRTEGQEAEVTRLTAVVEDRHEELEVALANEVAARPHQPRRRRKGMSFPFAGTLRTKTADYRSEYTSAEVQNA